MYPVIYQSEIDDLPEKTDRVTSLKLGLSKNQSILVRLGCYHGGEPDGLTREYAFPIQAAAQLSELLAEAVQQYLYDPLPNDRNQEDQG